MVSPLSVSPKPDQTKSLKPIKLQIFLVGDRCVEFCKKGDPSSFCVDNDKTNTCKLWIKDWMPADFASENGVSSAFKYYPPRKRKFIEQISLIASELCKDRKSWNCFYDSIGPSNDQNFSSAIIIKIGSFHRKIHWSLYLSSFSLLLFPGFFKEEWNMEISNVDQKNKTQQIQIPAIEIKNWFGWPFVLWGPAFAFSDEKALAEIIKYSIHHASR
ncbi:hypothetical protein CH352_10095 [Leptospira hartskeerlii]|uniref:Uncharacterized protein n=1 Tax=Leptospira hartskeerlii TaxID=2023177 RepID=A0A2M9XB48_9LEPT|nr:hypothetical protein [Leptospira hartskeerlii]PJZ24921.1 hypothetical protein CH357_11900 [Leptospira hartskeerlii]PJZ33313.1 hypothetical protein CH352_10095 [Leptospira hartskeerlii]